MAYKVGQILKSNDNYHIKYLRVLNVKDSKIYLQDVLCPRYKFDMRISGFEAINAYKVDIFYSIDEEIKAWLQN